jgi:hypothetical protein
MQISCPLWLAYTHKIKFADTDTKQAFETVTMETQTSSETQCKRSDAVLDRLQTAERPRSTTNQIIVHHLLHLTAIGYHLPLLIRALKYGGYEGHVSIIQRSTGSDKQYLPEKIMTPVAPLSTVITFNRDKRNRVI